MERRLFLMSLLGLAGAALIGPGALLEAQALPIAPPSGPGPRVGPEEAVASPQDIETAKAEDVRFRVVRRRRLRRRYVVRRRFYRPRVVVRRRYYRPRVVRRRVILRRRFY